MTNHAGGTGPAAICSTATTRSVDSHLLPDGKHAAASKLDRFYPETGS